MYRIKLLLVPLLLAACAETPEEAKEEDAPFTLAEPGKADGGGLVSTTDQQRIEAAFDAVVASGQATIAKLEQEIAKLEADAVKKQQEASALVMRIAQREQDLRRQYNTNLVLCAFFPNPAICILANYLANDSTLKSYKQQLAAAQAAQQRANAEAASYRVKRDDLRGRITKVRDAKTRLLAKLRDDQAPVIPAALADSPESGRAYGRIDLMTKIESAIDQEIGLLVELRNAAAELVEVTDRSIATLRALEQSVDQLVERQREQFMKLVSGYLAGDPAAVAERWLEDELARKTRELLDTLHWPMNEFARFLVETDGSPADVDALLERLLTKLLADDHVVVGAHTPVNIYDNTTATSTIEVTRCKTLASLEVYVDIQHTYIGDLEVSLRHGAQTYKLSTREGGGQDDLRRTFAVPAATGTELCGTWTLVVADKVKTDEGVLRGWQLVAR